MHFLYFYGIISLVAEKATTFFCISLYILIYALALNKSSSLPRLILKLSNMMEYVLYDVTDSKADLLEEISHINNYIDIENLRFKC